jgi:hypothetical protein
LQHNVTFLYRFAMPEAWKQWLIQNSNWVEPATAMLGFLLAVLIQGRNVLRPVPFFQAQLRPFDDRSNFGCGYAALGSIQAPAAEWPSFADHSAAF